MCIAATVAKLIYAPATSLNSLYVLNPLTAESTLNLSSVSLSACMYVSSHVAWHVAWYVACANSGVF